MALELFICGIGGQGIQLMAKTLALAALSEKRHVLLAAEYGFTMRGGSSHSSMTIGTDALNALPVLAKAGAAMIMHHQFLETPLNRLEDSALIVAEAGIVDKLPSTPRQTVISVDATGIARDMGNPMAAGLVLLSSFCTITGIVGTNTLVQAMESIVPSYRRQHVETNRRALEAGHEQTKERQPISLSEPEGMAIA